LIFGVTLNLLNFTLLYLCGVLFIVLSIFGVIVDNSNTTQLTMIEMWNFGQWFEG
jgi:hypothetical protein